ncbi:MAG TPA: hypothetical protein VF828_03705 [Patescibacteria group bacterium]
MAWKDTEQKNLQFSDNGYYSSEMADFMDEKADSEPDGMKASELREEARMRRSFVNKKRWNGDGRSDLELMEEWDDIYVRGEKALNAMREDNKEPANLKERNKMGHVFAQKFLILHHARLAGDDRDPEEIIKRDLYKTW